MPQYQQSPMPPQSVVAWEMSPLGSTPSWGSYSGRTRRCGLAGGDRRGLRTCLPCSTSNCSVCFILVSKDVIVRLSAPAAMPDAGCHVPVLLPWTLIPLDNNHRQINSQKLPLLLYHSSGKGVSPLNQGISNPSCAQAE